jgi:DNA-damage-inducible protein J
MLYHCFIIAITMKNLQVRLPEGLREEADHVLNDIGMDMSTAIRVYLRKVVQTRSIPFSLEVPQGSSQVLPVESDTQKKMDAVATAWRKTKR